MDLHNVGAFDLARTFYLEDNGIREVELRIRGTATGSSTDASKTADATTPK